MKYIGFAIIFAAAFIALRSYTENEKNKLIECRDFLNFIRHIRLKMSCFLSSSYEAAKDFSSEALTRVEFLSKLSECGNAFSAYKHCSDKLSLGENERSILEHFFKNAGSGYLDDELKLADMAESELAKALSRLEVDVPKNIKVATTLFITALAGAFILII